MNLNSTSTSIQPKMPRPYDPKTNSLLIGHDIFNQPIWQKFTLYSGSGSNFHGLPGNFSQIIEPSPYFESRFDNSLTDTIAIAANRANVAYDAMLELDLVEPLSHLRQLLDHTAIMEFQRLTFPIEQLPAEAKVVHEAYERVFGQGVAPIEVLVRAKLEMMDRGIKEIGETETLRDWVAIRDLEMNPTVEEDERLGILPVSDSEREKEYGSVLKQKNREVSEVSANLEDLESSQETSEEYASTGAKRGIEQDGDGSNSDASTVRLR